MSKKAKSEPTAWASGRKILPRKAAHFFLRCADPTNTYTLTYILQLWDPPYV